MSNDDEKKVIGELRFVERQPTRKLDIPSTADAETMVDVRMSLLRSKDNGLAVFANMMNTREYVSKDGEEPDELVVIKPEKNGDVTLGINFKLFSRLSHTAQLEIIKEQMLKIPYGHVSSKMQRLASRYGHEIANRASQMVLAQVVNTSILADEGIILPVPEMWDFPRNLTTEEYCELLAEEGGGAMPAPAKLVINGSDGQPHEVKVEHEDPEVQEMLQKLLDKNGLSKLDSAQESQNVDSASIDSTVHDLINKVDSVLRSKDSSLKQQGFMSGEAEEFIKALDKTPEIGWQHYLRGLHGKYQSRKRIISPKKPPRRGKPVKLPDGGEFWFYRGRKRDKTVMALIVVDTSGSMSAEELGSIDCELRALKQRGARVMVMQVDAGVAKEPEEYHSAKRLEHWFGRGGTSFVPAFEYIEGMRKRPDYVAYFTDGYGNAPEEEPEVPVLWILTPGGYDEERFKEHVCDWGDVCKIKRHDNDADN